MGLSNLTKKVGNLAKNGPSDALQKVNDARKDISKQAQQSVKAVQKLAPGNGNGDRIISSQRNIHKIKPAPEPVKKEQPKPHPTTMSAKATGEFHAVPGKVEFPWEKIGFFIDSKHPPSVEKLRDLSSEASSHRLHKYICEKYYSDFYWNCWLAVGTLFFAWLAGFIGGGILTLIGVLLWCSTIYRSEFRRFGVDLRDTMSRVSASESLDSRMETMDWLNSFLAKFWVIYMPALSEMVITQANNILKDVEPPTPIKKLSLDEFTLGSKAPRVDSVRAYTKLGKDLYRMDWDFGFTPNDTDGMTKAEKAKKVDPKVALGISIGKGVVSASLPILVEDMSFSGKMRITFKLCDTFPFIEIVSVMFLSPPEIDYALKPVGGNTFGIDIMSLIPGLSSFVNGVINATLAPMMYAPNHMDFNVQELMETAMPSAMGCVALKIRGLEYTRTSDKSLTVNPYLEYWIDGSTMKKHTTDIKSATRTPIFNELQYLLTDAITEKIHFELWTVVEKKNSDPKKELEVEKKKLAEAVFDIQSLVQEPEKRLSELKLEYEGKNAGKLICDFKWFALRTDESQTENDPSGILELGIESASGLSTKESLLGKLSSYADVTIGEGKEQQTYKTRVVKSSNNPDYGYHIEHLVLSKSNTPLKIDIMDTSSYGITKLGTYECKSVADLISLTGASSKKAVEKTIPLTTGAGKLFLTAQWKPLGSVSIDDNLTFVPPMGTYRVLISRCENLKNLETIGKIDPYVIVSTGRGNKEYARTSVADSTLEPIYNEVFYIPVQNPRQPLRLSVMDVEKMEDDRLVGDIKIDVQEFFRQGYDAQREGANARIVKGSLTRRGKPSGVIFYKVVYLPLIEVYSRVEKKQLEQKKKQAEEKANNVDELDKQAKMLEDYKKHPDDYEWVDEETKKPVAEKATTSKVDLDLPQLLAHNSGVLGINVVRGQLQTKHSYVQMLFDERSYPEFVAGPSRGKKLQNCTGEAFIRDLKNSVVTLRVTRAATVKSRDSIVSQVKKPISVYHLLQEAYNKPYKIDVGESSIEFTLEYAPCTVDLGPSETMDDTGMLHLNIMGATGLMAADRGGKSDPFCCVMIDGKEVYRTQTIKKTLDPVFDETCTVIIPSRTRSEVRFKMFDWDAASDNDPLGDVVIDLTKVPAGKKIMPAFNLDTQGILKLAMTFEPMYIQPSVIASSGGLDALVGMPGKLIGDVAGGALNIAGGVAGGAFNVAEGVTGGALNVAGGVAGGALNVAGGVTGGALNAANGVASGLMHGFHHHKGKKKEATPSTSTAPNGSTPAISVSQTPAVDSNNHQTISKRASMLSMGNDPNQKLSRPSIDTNASLFSTSLSGAVTPGIVKIVSFQVPDSNTVKSSSICVRVSLRSPRKVKNIFRTRGTKYTEKAHGFAWDESVPFKAAAGAQVMFSIREHKRIGRGNELGSASVVLSDVSNKDTPVTLPVEINGSQCGLTVGFTYKPVN